MADFVECKNYPLDIEDGLQMRRNAQIPRVVEAAAPAADRWLSALKVLDRTMEVLKRTHQSRTGAFEVEAGTGRPGSQD